MMTEQQAKREAQKRWGRDGWIETGSKQGVPQCYVGKYTGNANNPFGRMKGILGVGSTWEAAFEEASR